MGKFAPSFFLGGGEKGIFVSLFYPMQVQTAQSPSTGTLHACGWNRARRHMCLASIAMQLKKG